MFFIIYLIALYLFLTQIKSIDLGILGKIRYIGDFSSNPTRISEELYAIFIVCFIILGVLAIKNVIDVFKNRGNNDNDNQHKIVVTNDNNLRLEQLIKMQSKGLITNKEFVEMKKKICFD